MSSSTARYFPGAFGKGTPSPAEAEASQSSSTEATRVECPGQLCLPSDEALMASICDGDKEALALLFRRCARIVRGVVYRVLRDTSEADDMVQEVFLLIIATAKRLTVPKAQHDSGLCKWLTVAQSHGAVI